MKNYSYLMTLASLLVIAGCNKELDVPENPATDPAPVDLVEMTFQAIAEKPNTGKTAIDLTDGSVSWSAGDAVKFIYELDKTPGDATSDALAAEDIEGGEAKFTAGFPEEVASAFAKTEAQFTGTSRHLYAVYPSGIAHDYSNASTLYVTVPSTQDGSFANASIALAKWDKTNPTAPLQFDNLCGLLQFVITDASVRSVVISSSATLAGKACVTFTVDPAGKPTVRGAVQAPATSITVNVNGAGTYYAAVLPTELTDVYVALYDAADGTGNLLGDRVANNSIPVARKQVRKLGTISTAFSDRMYFKVDGTGSGTSWDDAAGLATLKSTMKSTTAVTKDLFIAAGTYNFTDIDVSPSVAGCTFKLYGGYPAASTGMALSGRDVANNETLFKSDDGKRSLRWNKGNWIVDGISFTSIGYPNNATGCALLIMPNIESIRFNNCSFKNSVHGAEGSSIGTGGAVRVDHDALFTNCLFENNNSLIGNAGAVVVSSGKTFTATNCIFRGNSVSTSGKTGGAIYCSSGTVILEKCLFDSNTAAGNGGAIYNASGTVKIRHCDFVSNTTGSAGGAIYSAGSGNVLYVDACNFRHVTTVQKGASASGGNYIEASAGTVGVNNCVFTGSWGVNGCYQIRSTSQMNIVNSTFNCQLGAGNVHNNTDGICKVVNSIFLNAASSGDGNNFVNMGTMDVLYSLYNKSKTENPVTTETGCVSGVKGNTASTVFPAWYTGSWSKMAANDLTTAVAVDDCRENVRYYSWGGVIPDGSGTTGTLVNPSLAQVKSAISDSAFLTWLGDAALSVDIRGASRTTSAMWPGSYEN